MRRQKVRPRKELKMPKTKKTDLENTEVNDLKVKIDDLTLALQRERADAINLRRRHEEEMTNLRLIIKANVVRELLPVIDNFNRALNHIPKELEESSYVKGVQGVVKQFEKTLSDMGVTKIVTVGERFDPRLHEAISMEEGNGSEEIISEEVQTGYTLNGEVVRHAMVKVKMQ